MKIKIIAVDGFDGTGKTSICKKIEEELGVLYIKPFDKTGEIIRWLHENEQEDISATIGRESMFLELSKHNEFIYVCDRNWVSMLVFSGVDIKLDKIQYLNIMTTSTEDRISDVLKSRGEKLELDNIRKYVPLYDELAKRNGIKTIDTTNRTVDESFNLIKDDLLSFMNM